MTNPQRKLLYRRNRGWAFHEEIICMSDVNLATNNKSPKPGKEKDKY